MKKSHIALLLVFLLLIPATLFIGTKLTGKSYYITATLIILELMLPFFLAFEGRKVQARELVLIAVMCALAIVGRVAIPVPNFKATFAIIILTGIAFGPETGFMVGAMTAFISNFFYGQGPYAPWQMIGYGAGGMLAGFLFRKGWLPRNRWLMAIFGFLTVILWIGPIMDISNLFLMFDTVSGKGLLLSLLSGFPVNFSNGICTVLVLFLFGKPLLEKLDRIKLKYGMLNGNEGNESGL